MEQKLKGFLFNFFFRSGVNMNPRLVPSAFSPLFVNFCDFKNSQDYEIMKIRKVKLQLLWYKTKQILALTRGKRES